MWNGYGICPNLASSGEPPPLLYMTTLTTVNYLEMISILSRVLTRLMLMYLIANAVRTIYGNNINSK